MALKISSHYSLSTTAAVFGFGPTAYTPVLDGMLATFRLGISYDTPFTKESTFVVDAELLPNLWNS